jgi:hypothetical protein
VTTGVAPSVLSIDMDNRRAAQCMAAFLVAIGINLRLGIRTISDLVERRFADFADVPYPNPLSRLWEELWETEAEPWQLRILVPRTTASSPSDR